MKPYVSPTVIAVKLDTRQAILSQCSVGVTELRNSNAAGLCNPGPVKRCKAASGQTGGPTATS